VQAISWTGTIKQKPNKHKANKM